MTNDPRDWMWSDALEMLARAERLHREVFNPLQKPTRGVSWEPPTDVLETEEAVLIFVALPGVDPEKVELTIQAGRLIIAGERRLPVEARTAIIHRLELPQGRFERRIPLPAGSYEKPRGTMSNGCLVIRLAKTSAQKAKP